MLVSVGRAEAGTGIAAGTAVFTDLEGDALCNATTATEGLAVLVRDGAAATDGLAVPFLDAAADISREAVMPADGDTVPKS